MLGWMSAETWGPKRMTEMTGAYDGGAVGASSGLMAGTRVATALGWRPVETLTEGDLVLTFDAGMQPITKINRSPIWDGDSPCPRRFWSLNVPTGALGNRGELNLMPGQYVMVESDAGEELFGDPFSLINAATLKGTNGIEAVPPQHGQDAIVLHFETDQVVFAESGVLFYCPSSSGLLDQALVERSGPPYKALNEADAEILVWCIESERALDKVWAHSSPVQSVA